MKKENSMKFKRFFALALAALLVMSLFAGCSKNSDTPGSKTNINAVVNNCRTFAAQLKHNGN